MVEGSGLLVLIAVGIATLISATLAVYAHYNTGVPAAVEFRNLQASVTFWGLCELAVYLSPATWSAVEAVYIVRFVASALTAILSIVFIAEYTQSRLLNRTAVRRLLWGGFAGGMILWVVNPSELAYEALAVQTFQGITIVNPAFGPGIVVYFAFIYGFFAVVYAVLGGFLLDSTNLYRKQTALIAVAFLVVIVGTIVVVLTISPREGIDFATVLNAISGGIIWIAIYRYEFLSVLPLAKDSILEKIADPVFVLDERDHLVYANDVARKLGITGPDANEEFESLLADIETALSEDTVFQYDDQYAGTATGVYQVFEPAAETIVDRHGLDRGRVIILRDITDRYRREQRLDEFASLVSHDLRNPLNIAQGRLAMAREETDNEHLDDVAHAHTRIAELIDDVLRLTRIGNELGEVEPVDLGELASSCWDAVRTADATLHVDTTRTIEADSGRLRQLVENLLRNAVEHGGNGVTVTVGDCDGGFYVEDDGGGIPEEDLGTVFESGYSTSSNGTGLGLSIVQQVVEAHDWKIRVTEGTDGGARFEITGL